MFIFFVKLQHPKLIGRGNISEKQPTNKVKSTNKDGERNRKGRRKKEGGDQSNFLWRRIALLGLSGGVPVLQLKANFFY